MKIPHSSIFKIASTNIYAKYAEYAFLKFKIDITRPVEIHAIINTICNCKCPMCDYWQKDPLIELPASVWNSALKSLSGLSKGIHVNFSGGEPLLKKDLFEILSFCHDHAIATGLTTNGLLLNEKNISRLIECDLFNLNISLDSLQEPVHDYLRGHAGILRILLKNIGNLMESVSNCKSPMRVILKPVVCTSNLQECASIVEYAERMGMSGVNFQPMHEWSDGARELFKVDMEKLEQVVNTLVTMKRRGHKILNSESAIRQWVTHFSGLQEPRTTDCPIALRNLFINADGAISLCPFRKAIIGNISQENIASLWHSVSAKTLRHKLVKCRNLCTATCVVKRKIPDYINLFKSFFNG